MCPNVSVSFQPERALGQGNGSGNATQTTPRSAEESCIPTQDRNWGFCDKTCRVETLPSVLQELTLSVIPDRECVQLINDARNGRVRIDIEVELCAGKKNYLPKFPVYTRVQGTNGTSVSA